jgi:thiamine-phosphate pyrophosphorylase
MQERCGADLAFHLRLRRTPVRRWLALAESLEEGAVETDGWLAINRRLDIALAVGADAVQLGRGALPIAAVRDVAGDSLRIGASVHDLPTADRCRLEGADYLVAGAVYETESHRGTPPAGIELIERLSPMDLPVVAIGGITLDRVAEVCAAGAAGVAVIRAVWNAPEAVEAAAALCEALADLRR